MSTGDAGSLSSTLDRVSRDVRAILARVLDGTEVTVPEAETLAVATGRDLQALTLVADELRHRQVGDAVTYVVNRNINFTNVCIKHCGFCAFSRDHREEEGYLLPIDEVVRRAREAWELGATEVCIQAGLPPKLDGRFYIDLTRALRAALPKLHLHAFSPEEVLYGSIRSGLPIQEYLTELKDAGLGTLPGTSAEILDQPIRDLIARGRITVDQWMEVITTAHALGIRTTSTIMYGHVETAAHWVRHMALLRSIQKDTGGFTEFVPLSLIHSEAPMYSKALVPGVRPGATGFEVDPHARAGPPDARPRPPQHPGIMGEGGTEVLPGAARRRRQRPRRHPHQRVDLDVGRRPVRPARGAGRAGAAGFATPVGCPSSATRSTTSSVPMRPATTPRRSSTGSTTPRRASAPTVASSPPASFASRSGSRAPRPVVLMRLVLNSPPR